MNLEQRHIDALDTAETLMFHSDFCPKSSENNLEPLLIFRKIHYHSGVVLLDILQPWVFGRRMTALNKTGYFYGRQVDGYHDEAKYIQ
jgi:hypothetical protein